MHLISWTLRSGSEQLQASTLRYSSSSCIKVLYSNSSWSSSLRVQFILHKQFFITILTASVKILLYTPCSRGNWPYLHFGPEVLCTRGLCWLLPCTILPGTRSPLHQRTCPILPSIRGNLYNLYLVPEIPCIIFTLHLRYLVKFLPCTSFPDHDGGQPMEVNACILITHMVYL